MSLNIENAKAWMDVLRQASIRPDFFVDDAAIDAYLDARDMDPFDQNWSSAHDALSNALTSLSWQERDAIESLQAHAGEQSYMAVIRQTGSAELAAYASDDVRLVIAYVALGKVGTFVSSMREAYERGEFPA